MRLTPLLPVLIACLTLTQALVTFSTMRNLTAVTEEVLGRIIALDGRMPDGQVVMIKGGDEDGAEDEVVCLF